MYPDAAVVSDKFENVATPLDAVAVNLPPRVALPGLLASATVTVPSKDVIGLPELFLAKTVRPNGLPAVALGGGSCVTTSCDVVRVTTPIELVPGSVNQMLPSGANRDAVWPGVGGGNGEKRHGVRARVYHPDRVVGRIGEPDVAVGTCRN